MIGRLPHPLDARRSVYVGLMYHEASDGWRPLHGRYFATELDAFRACAKELTLRAEALNTGHGELTANLERLLDAVGMEDIVHVGRVLHRLNMRTGQLVPVNEPEPGEEEKEPEEAVIMEEVIESLARARQRTKQPLSAERLRRVSVLLGRLADDWDALLAEPEVSEGDAGGDPGEANGDPGKTA